MSWIIFNGVDSRDMGVVIERLPDLHRPKRNITYTPVSGRDGRLGVEDGSYDIYQATMRVNCFGAQLRDVYAWLNGTGWLTTSLEPDRKVLCDVNAQISDSHWRRADGGNLDTLSVSLYCQPFRYFHPDAPADEITGTPYTIRNPGTAKCRPRITVEGSGDVMIMLTDLQSGEEWMLEFEGLEDGVAVDCDMEECMSIDGTKLLNSIATFDDFPELPSGNTAISWTGNVSKVTVEKRCRDL